MKAAIIALLVGGFARNATGQVLYGSVVGTVTDPAGATVSGVAVTVRQLDSGVIREGLTDDAGRYTLVNLVPGAYDLHLSKPGFRQHSQTGLAITMNAVIRVDASLELGEASEVLTVTAATALQADKADVHADFEAPAVRSISLGAFRNYQRLIDLVPGVRPGQVINAITDTPARALVNNANGVNRNNNRTWLDGALNVFLWLPHNAVYVPPVESIEAVNIATNNFDAEQGMAGGMAVMVNTRSGGNDFHGALFAYYDNQDLRARNFFLGVSKRPRSVTNIDGAVIGGPIVHNKLFFFFVVGRVIANGQGAMRCSRWLRRKCAKAISGVPARRFTIPPREIASAQIALRFQVMSYRPTARA